MKTKKQITKQILSIFLCFVMLLTYVPLTVFAADGTPVAKVGDVEYTNFATAVANWTDNTTLTLLADVTGLTEQIKISGNGLVLDLNGKKLESTVDNALRITGGELTIRDSVGTGSLTTTTDYDSVLFVDNESAVVNFESGTMESVYVGYGTFNMTGGKIYSEKWIGIGYFASGTVNISGGEITSTSRDAIYNNYGTLTVTGTAKITSTNGYAIRNYKDCNLTTISGDVVLSGSKGEFYLGEKIVLNTQPTDGTKWDVSIDTGVNTGIRGGVFAIPGESVTLDASKFVSAMDGYEIGVNAKGQLLLCNHTGRTGVSNDNGTHDVTCYCGKTTFETNVACSGGVATDTHQAYCVYCNAPYGELNPDVHCDIFAVNMTAEQLQSDLLELLNTGKTDISIILAPDADDEMFSAINTALCSSTAAEGSVDLTIAGVPVIPDYALGNGHPDPELNTDPVALKTLNLPDAVTLEMSALVLPNVQAVYLPKVTEWEIWGIWNADNISTLVLTAPGTITADFTELNTGNIDLTLHCDKKTDVTDGTTWQGETWKSISFTHNWTDGTCTDCGEVCAHSGGEATCVSKAVCEACGEEYGEIDENNHTSFNPEYQWYPNADGTCYVSATLYCSDCGEYVDGASDYATQTSSVEATDCQNPGSVTYSITLTMNGKEYTATETFPVESDNHVGELDNGFCSVCGGYEKPEAQQGEYEWETIYLIDNAGKLFWFADYINNVTNEADALVTADITIPEGKEWTPIMNFYGTFDGNFKTISGLNCVSDGEQVGMFGGGGYSYGTIKNVHITNSRFEGTNYVGGLAGYHAGEIRNCYVDNTVTVVGTNHTGALVGNLAGSMYNCYAYADSLIGTYDSNYTTVENNYYLAETETTDGGKTAEQFASGEVAYLLQAGILGEDLYDDETGDYIGTTDPEHIWGQNIGTEKYPVFKGEKVYKNQIGGCCEENYIYGYSNTSEPTYSHIYDENGACVCGDLNYFVIGKLSSQIRFGTNDDGSYAHTFDIRTRAKITDEDFKRFVGETNDIAVENIKKAGFVYSINPEAFSMEDAQAVAKGGELAGYTDAPVDYIQDADGYYMFTCMVIDIPDSEIAQTLVSFAYICVEIDGVEYWYFMDATAQADFNSLYTTYIPMACEAYGWESFGDFEENGDGTHTRACAICGETETGDCVYDEYVSNDNGTHNVVCSLCGHISTNENCNFENDNTCLCGQKIVGSFTVSDLTPFGSGWANDTEEKLDGVSSGDVQDEGKTAWEVGDVVFVTLTSQKCGAQTAELTYGVDGEWSTDACLYYLKDETPTVSVIYAPCYEVTADGKLQLKDGIQLGMTEYLVGDCELGDGIIEVTFEGAIRDYSRLRIVSLPNQELTVTTTEFTPVGTTSMATEPYTLTADRYGNAYLYGTFAEGATIVVKQGEVVLAEYAFTAEKDFSNGTEQGMSYVLDARPVIDGTLGGKTEATEEDLAAMVELLRSYVENGLTTIIVTGYQPAKLLKDGYLTPVVSLAFEQLTYAYWDENIDSYWGTVDLIYQDVTEIVEYEFYCCDVLKSITLPNVTTVGDRGFWACYYLETLTFGSVVTDIYDNSGEVFYTLGYKIGGCNLVLDAEQVNAETDYQPNIETNMWWNTEWKSITLK